jgi:class 3 adenylate cyclase
LTPRGTEPKNPGVAQFTVKNLRSPEERIRMPGAVADLVTLGDVTVGREVDDPGWRWSVDMRPIVGGEWCESHHVGVVLSGRAGFLLRDGTTFEVGPDDVFDVPPGHDSWTLGDEPMVCIEWSGLRSWVGSAVTFGDRVLATLLFVDVVESTTLVAQVGDTRWRELLGGLFEAAHELLAEYRGRFVDSAGDGLFATFDSPGRALQFAAALRTRASAQGLTLRAGVHVGEVEVTGAGVRGLAVHEAARVMSAAAPGEILVSAVTRGLAGTEPSTFEDRGEYQLKGLEGPRVLYAYTG